MSATDLSALSAAVERRMPLAAALFDEVRGVSVDEVGITRPAWSEQDQAAADILARAAGDIGLDTAYDRAGNLCCNLPGKDSSAPAILIGSHLDSVPTGGHFDGLAGFIADPEFPL